MTENPCFSSFGRKKVILSTKNRFLGMKFFFIFLVVALVKNY